MNAWSLSTTMLAQTNASRENMLLYVWIGIAVLAVIIQALMAVWVAKDAKNSGKSPGWAAFVAIPGVGLIGLFIYILIPGGPSPEELQRQRELAGLQQQVQQMQQENQRVREEAERKVAEMAHQQPLSAPTVRKHTTVISALPSKVVSLTQFGGRNHGMTFSLAMRGPDGVVQRNRIGRDASCHLSFPEDEAITSEHCILTEDANDSKVYVIDLASANGTVLERDGKKGRIAAKTALQDGDYLILGNTRLRIQVIEPQDTPEPLPEFNG